METKQIETFIKKYSLNGLIEGVLWTNDGNGNLTTTAMTSDRKTFSSVIWEKAAFFDNNVDIVVQDTTKLKRLLSLFNDNVSLNLDIDENDKTRVRQIIIDDGTNTAIYVAGVKDVIDKGPKIKTIPQFEVEIVLSPEFVDFYNKSVSIINDDQALFTLVMSKKKQKIEMVFGYRQKNLSDQIVLSIKTNQGKDTVKSPISFNAKHFKEILTANNSEVENSVLSISEAGLASVAFDKDGFKSQYYMVKTDVEN